MLHCTRASRTANALLIGWLPGNLRLADMCFRFRGSSEPGERPDACTASIWQGCGNRVLSTAAVAPGRVHTFPAGRTRQPLALRHPPAAAAHGYLAPDSWCNRTIQSYGLFEYTYGRILNPPVNGWRLTQRGSLSHGMQLRQPRSVRAAAVRVANTSASQPVRGNHRPRRPPIRSRRGARHFAWCIRG